MSDTGGGDSTDLAGGGRFSQMRASAGRGMVRAGAKLGNVGAQTTEFKGLAAAIDSVTASLQKLSEKSGSYADKIARDLGKVSTAMGGGSAAGGSSNSAAYAAQRSTIPAAPAAASPVSEENSASPSLGSRAASAGFSAVSWLGSAASSDMTASLAMTPLRFMRDRMQSNRQVVAGASNALNMTMLRQSAIGGGLGGLSQEDMLAALGKNIGGVKGTASELIGLMASAGQYGASYGFDNPAGTGVRGAGFFQGIRQAQALNPGASVQSIVGAIGGQAANTGAQQQSVMMTGGAYSMVGAGGRQKSLTAWADGVMKWLIDLRPPPDRGKPFSYGELMAQYYPGSNIDAWFNANQVSQEMREYWWTYELGKVSGSISADSNGDLFQLGPGGQKKNNLAALRLESTNVMTQGEFALGSKMSGAYGNREQSNRAFNEMIQSFLANALPAALASGPLSGIQFMPDMIEDLLMGLLERMPGSAKTIVGGAGIASMFMGDVGDIGDTMPGAYGAQGGTTTSGMHPDMKRKIGAMQRANPRIRITSGLRDTGLQQRLKKKGYKNVSGKASAHTRGMAADLGPASEYGWIAQNANKFGLASGKSHGEPWHVGMGDTDGHGVGDGIVDFFTNLMKGGSGTAETMFDMMSSVLGMLSGGLGASADSMGPSFDTGLYERLQTRMRGGMSLQSHGGGGGGGTSSGEGGFSIGAGPAGSQDAGIAAATALFNAGFRDKASLEKMTAISWRESRWNPAAKNPNTSDRGLMQINMAGQKKLLQQLGYGETDLFDIQKNAQVAYRVYQDAGNSYWPWGMTATGWSRNGDPLYGTAGSNAADVVKASGLPVGDMAEYMTPMGGPVSQGKNVVFVNTFNLQGGVGGAGGGIDVRRTVTQMADHLENEMKTRLARAN